MATTLADTVADATANTQTTKPVKVFKHRAISAGIFVNDVKNGGRFHCVSLQRTYKVDDEFRHSSSFTRDE